MGKYVHVIKKHAEYGDSEAFNWKSEDFHSLLGMTQNGGISGDEFHEFEFELLAGDYQKSLKIVALYARYKRNIETTGMDKLGDYAKVLAMLGENDTSGDEFVSKLDDMGGCQTVLKAMVKFYVERDRASEYISFHVW